MQGAVPTGEPWAPSLVSPRGFLAGAGVAVGSSVLSSGQAMTMFTP